MNLNETNSRQRMPFDWQIDWAEHNANNSHKNERYEEPGSYVRKTPWREKINGTVCQGEAAEQGADDVPALEVNEAAMDEAIRYFDAALSLGQSMREH